MTSLGKGHMAMLIVLFVGIYTTMLELCSGIKVVIIWYLNFHQWQTGFSIHSIGQDLFTS